jgi:PAS domain S-box-containing protein
MNQAGGSGLERSRRLRRRLVPLAVWLVLVGLFAGMLAWAERSSRRELEQRFALRGVLAARFTEAYIDELADREQQQARDFLSSGTVDEQSFQRVVAAFGYQAAVLLDGDGRVLRVTPPKHSLIGQNLAEKYQHLRQAGQGQVAVSKAVLSAARRTPVVAVAVPFATPYGRRVFSGGYELAQTPIAAYLKNASPIGSSELYLVDQAGIVVASNRPLPASLVDLKTQDPNLAGAMARQPAGSYHASSRRSYFFVSEPVAGTPWRLVAAVDKASLYEPLGGASRWGPWLVLGAFAVGGLLFALLLLQYLEGQARRRQLEGELSAQRELSERLLHGLSALGEGVLLAEGNRIVFANEAFCQLGGYSYEELLRLPSSTALPSPPEQQAPTDHNRELDAAEPAGVFEAHLVHKSGRVIPIEAAAKLIRHGGRTQRLSVARDITERKQWSSSAPSCSRRSRRLPGSTGSPAWPTGACGMRSFHGRWPGPSAQASHSASRSLTWTTLRCSTTPTAIRLVTGC